MLGAIDDFWYRWVADIGITGADQGKGGKYLVLPPGYEGKVPSGYFVVRPNTFGNFMSSARSSSTVRRSPASSLVKKTFRSALGDTIRRQ